MATDSLPKSVADLKRALEAGRCFRAEANNVTLYLEFVETVGWVYTETWNGEDAFTTAASNDVLRTALKKGIEEIDHEDIPE